MPIILTFYTHKVRKILLYGSLFYLQLFFNLNLLRKKIFYFLVFHLRFLV
jgi:hypothetical protein